LGRLPGEGGEGFHLFMPALVMRLRAELTPFGKD
jgi:hypothetical protein